MQDNAQPLPARIRKLSTVIFDASGHLSSETNLYNGIATDLRATLLDL
jgi:hypothetical protein